MTSRLSGTLGRGCRGFLCLLALFLLLQGVFVQAHAATTSTYVFYEKFSRDNPHKWSELSLTDGSKTYISAGTYQVVRAHPGIMRGWPLAVRMPSGVQFNAQLQFASGTDPYAGLTFWDNWGNDFTMFAVTPSGEAGLFRHSQRGWSTLVDWQPFDSVHRGFSASNTMSINLDRRSGALGRTFLINGVPLGKACADTWRATLGAEPTVPPGGLYVGVVAGSFDGAAHVSVLHASMYDGTHVTPVPACPAKPAPTKTATR